MIKKKYTKHLLLTLLENGRKKKNKLIGLDVIKLYQKSFYKFLPKGSFFKSRISQIIIFVLSFNSLKNLLKKEKPNYLVSHLIISLPLVYFFF